MQFGETIIEHLDVFGCWPDNGNPGYVFYFLFGHKLSYSYMVIVYTTTKWGKSNCGKHTYSFMRPI